MTTLSATKTYQHEKLPWRWTLVIFAYLFVEWVYNQHLLELVQYSSVTALQFEWTEMFGKAIASVGLNLVLAKCYRNPGIIKFIFGVCLAYAALSWVFDVVIESFPDEFRHSSYYGVMHRKTVVEGKDPGHILAFPQEQPWYVRPLILSQYYLTLQDTQWTDVESQLRKPLDKKFNAALKDKKNLWTKYSKAEEARQYLDGGWQSYQDAMYKYGRYRNDARYAKRARDTFVSRVGAEPDLTREQFIRVKAPKYHAYIEAILVEGNRELGVATIRGRDVPLRMDEKAFYRYLDNTAQTIRTTVAPTATEIQRNAASKDAVALLVIPPLSIGLSLLSIVVNLIGLACAWAAVFFRAGWQRRAACFLVCAILGTGVAMAYTSAPHAVRGSDYWVQLDKQFEQEHPLVWSAMSIPMRLQPYICVTAQPVAWISAGMRVLYKPGIQK